MRRTIENRSFADMMKSKTKDDGWQITKASDPFYPGPVEIGEGKDWVNTTPKGNGDDSEGSEKTMKAANIKADPNGGAKSISTKNVLEQDKVNDASGVEDASSTHIEESAEGEKRFKEEMAKQPPATNLGEAERNVHNVLNNMERKKGDPFKTVKSLGEMITEKNGTGFFKAGGAAMAYNMDDDDPFMHNSYYSNPDSERPFLVQPEGYEEHVPANNIGGGGEYIMTNPDAVEEGEMPYQSDQWKTLAQSAEKGLFKPE